MSGMRSNRGATSIADKTRGNRLRWLERVLRREQTETVRLVKETYVGGEERRGQKVVESDMKRAIVDAGDRVMWK